jgi:hypothetical protein
MASLFSTVWRLKVWKHSEQQDLVEFPTVAGFVVVLGKREHKCAGLDCQNDIGLFRRLAQRRFCCEEHEQHYFATLDQLAIERLQNARPAASVGRASVEIPRPGEGHLNTQSRQVPGQPEQTLSLSVPPTISAFRPSAASQYRFCAGRPKSEVAIRSGIKRKKRRVLANPSESLAYPLRNS